jgi:cell division protein FtsB
MHIDQKNYIIFQQYCFSGSMQDEEVITQLQSLIEQLRQENELLKERIKELEARLAQ